jgi:hypothetical protein
MVIKCGASGTDERMIRLFVLHGDIGAITDFSRINSP